MTTKAGLSLLLLIAALSLAAKASEGAEYAVDGQLMLQHQSLRNLLELSAGNLDSIPTDHVDEAILAKLQRLSPEQLNQVAEQAKQDAPKLFDLYAPLLADKLTTPGLQSLDETKNDVAISDNSATAATAAAAATTVQSAPVARMAAAAADATAGDLAPTGLSGCQAGFHACQGLNATICAVDYPSDTCPVPGAQPRVCGDNQAVDPRFGTCMDCAYGKNGTACYPCQPAAVSPPVTENGTVAESNGTAAGTASVFGGSCAYCPASNPSNGRECEGLTCPPGSGFLAARRACIACTMGTAGNGTTTSPCPMCPAGTYADTVALGSCKSCRTIAQIMDFYRRGYILAVTDETGKRGSRFTPCNTPCPSNTASIDGVTCAPCRNVPGYGMNSQGNCVPCPPGQYATSSMSSCAACPAGTTSNQLPNSTYYYAHERNGSYTNQLRHVCTPSNCDYGNGLSVTTGECIKCAPGTAGEGNTSYPCPPCPPATYSDDEGFGNCVRSCRTVSYIQAAYRDNIIFYADSSTGQLISNTSLGNIAPQPCDRPCPNPGTASVNGLTCSPCRAVAGFGLDAQGRCSMCPPGQYATNNMPRCAPCPAGTSSNQNNNPALLYANQLRHVCKSCGPTFEFSFLIFRSVYYVGGVSKAGAATCTQCNTTSASTTGWSWRGLACNASCADIPGWQVTGSGCRPCDRNTVSPGDGVTPCTACSNDPFLYAGTGFSNCSDDMYATSGNCFPGHAQLTVLGTYGTTQHVAAEDVHVGDTVQVVLSDGTLGFSRVFAMPHLSSTGRAAYYTLTTASGHKLQLSGSHYIYHAPSPASTWEQRVAVAGKDVTPGHVLWVVDQVSGELVQSPVSSVSLQEETGAFVFWTLEGHAVIDGTAPSSYSNTFGSEEAMDAVAQTAKRVYNLVGDKAARWLHDIGAINKVATVLKGAFRVHKQVKQGWGAEVARVLFAAAKA